MASELPNLDKLTLTEENTPKFSQKEYTYRGSGSGTGTDKEGNHYCLRDYGPNAINKHPYHYSNKDGSYGYSNPDGSEYYNDGKEKTWYKPVPDKYLFKDGKDGRWSRQPLNNQPGMSSAGFEEVQRMVDREAGCDESEIKREKINECVYSDNGVTDDVAGNLGDHEGSYNDEHYVRGGYGSSNFTTDNADHHSSDGGDVREYYAGGHRGYDGCCDDDTRHEDITDYHEDLEYEHDDCGYADTYGEPDDCDCGPIYEDYDNY